MLNTYLYICIFSQSQYTQINTHKKPKWILDDLLALIGSGKQSIIKSNDWKAVYYKVQ